jgi:phage/plasmid-like protein (TIGR03299 family)
VSIWSDPAEVQGKANIENMFYISSEGEPWHGLGKPVTSALTAEQALVESGQNWTVRTEGLQTTSGLPITDGRRCRAIVRDDTDEVLGIVGRRYQPIQNADAFNFLDSLAAERTIRFHTAGVLGRGERIWILAQLHGDIVIPKTDDVIKKFLLFSNQHDGCGSGRAFWTPVRVVCQNTLNQATRNAKGEGVVIRHTGDLQSKIVEARRILGLAVRAYDDFDSQVKKAAKFRLSDAQRKAYFASIYGPKSKRRNDEDGDVGDPDEASTRTRHTLERLERLAEEGKGNGVKGIRGSAWAAYNAVTEYVDHFKPTRVEGDPLKVTDADRQSKKLDSIWFGAGARDKVLAWENVKELVGLN